MIYSLNGTLIKKTAGKVVISCAGVGFGVSVPSSAHAAIGEVGEAVSLFTYMDVKEDGVELYGFATEEQQQCFKTLITVSGVGPKSALGILSLYSPDKIALAISANDHRAFCAVSGIGPKIAQRIVLELRGKLSQGGAAVEAATSAGAVSEAAEALVSMGFTRNEAASSLAGLPDNGDVGELIRLALQKYDERRG